MCIEHESSAKKPALALIGVPTSAGARRKGQDGAPAALRAGGLLERLRTRGVDVVDLGDLPTVTFEEDRGHPRRQNVDRVLAVARQTADLVDRALADGRWPLILGGDCTLSLGVIAGLLRHQSRVGLVYFDGDLDLNTPDTTESGILDGMVLSHALGRGVPELAGVGPRQPLLSEEDVVLFGYDEESGWIDPPELELLERSHIPRYSSKQVRVDAVAAAKQTWSQLVRRSRAILVHFDVDATNLPAADVPHSHGLDPETAFGALRVFVSEPECVGLVVTELNPAEDPDGTQAARLVDGLVEALGARTASAA